MEIIKKGAKYFKREDLEVNKENLIIQKAVLEQERDRIIGEIEKVDEILNKLI